MKNSGTWCTIFNTLVLILLMVLCGILIFNVFESTALRILLIILSFIPCGFLEQWVLSRFVNAAVELFFKED